MALRSDNQYHVPRYRTNVKLVTNKLRNFNYQHVIDPPKKSALHPPPACICSSLAATPTTS